MEKEKQARDVRQEVTDAIVKKLEAGVMPWRRGWSSAEQAKDALLLPRNGETGRAYRGGNRLYLMTMMQEKGWSDPRFMTFNQLQKLDAGPRKGEKGLPVEYWDELPFWKRRDVDVLLCGEKVKVHAVDPQLKIATVGDDRRDVHTQSLFVQGPAGQVISWGAAERSLNLLFAKYAVVFNVGQCRGLEKWLEQNPIEKPQRTEIGLDETLSKIVAGMEKTGLVVKHEPQDSAFYTPLTDRITMPRPQQFHSVAEYRSTLLHELGHATGHEKRLAREGITKIAPFGSEIYAKEELVAELTSAFMAAETGIERLDDSHASYIDLWLKALKGQNGKHVLFEAARDAEKATDYLLDRGRGIEIEKARETKAKNKGQELEIA